jgi:cytoskeletal protein CcmA (bactofilin family)
MRSIVMFAPIAATLLLGSVPASAQIDDIWRAGARVNVVSSDHHNVWAAGALVSVRGTVANELRAAGAEVDVDAATKGNTWVAGAIVSVKGSTDNNLYVAGARVNIDGRVGGALKAGAARLLVGARTEVGGPMRLGGADVIFAGLTHGSAEIYGDTVQIEGRIEGNLLVRARSVTVGKTALVNGNIVFETLDEPQIEEGATLRGRQTVTLPRPSSRDGWSIAKALGAIVVFGVGAGLVLGVILLIAARPFVERTVNQIRVAPTRSGLIGLAVLILVPLGAVLLMVTVIGIPIGLLTLLALPLLLLTASVVAAFAISDWIFNRARGERSFSRRLLLLLGGLILLAVIGLVPVLGFLTWLVAVLLGLGAIWHVLRTGAAPTPAA